MSDPMIILACLASYMAGGTAGMAILLIVRAGDRENACERTRRTMIRAAG